jgi:molecular chaperone DnaK
VGYALGIDLGTTFSAAALTQDGRTEIFPLGNRAATIPSVVVLRADGEVLIGDAAVRRAMSEPMRTAREFKRRLGDPTPLLLGGTPYGAESLMAKLLDGIVRQVVEQEGEEPEQIVVSHPANYGPYKLDLLEQAVRMSEIGNVTFIAEPIAAALHYSQRERIEPGEIVAVYDFGGGTFDAALLRKTEDGFEQLGEPEGIERLGGVDFDEAVFAHVVSSLGDRWSELDPTDPATMSSVARLRDDCREAKEGLSLDTDATIPVMLPNIQTEIRITRSEFEEMIRPRIHETIAALMRAVRSAGVDVSDIAKILLVGGSSRIPLAGQMVREATGVPVAIDAHPKHAIALGAATAASLAMTTREPETVVASGAAAGAAVAAAAVAASDAETLPASTPVVEPETEPVTPVADAQSMAATGAAAAAMPVANVPPAAAPVAPSGPPPAGAGGGSAPPPTGAPVAAGDGGSRLPIVELAIGGAVVLLLLIGVGAFLAFQYFTGDGDDDQTTGTLDTSGAVGLGSTATPENEAAAQADPTSTPEPEQAADPTATNAPTQAAVDPTATSVPPSPTVAPTRTPAPTATATNVPPPPTATVEPTRTPPVPPGVEFAHILDIEWDAANQRYEIEFEMYELDILHPDGIDDPNTAQLARPHVHFFVNTVPPEQAGTPGGGPWKLYAGESPYDGFTANDIPANATEICVLIANPDHSVKLETGNCFALPPRN